MIRNNKTKGVRFKYVIGQERMDEIGFVPYTEFPDIEKEYSKNILDIFAQRLNKPERPDIEDYYRFWEIGKEHRQDRYYILAHTQGLLGTDNFEFLATYHPTKNLSFVSEICGLSHKETPADFLKVGEELRWELEPSNKHDKHAVAVFKGEQKLGYIKIIHNRVFYNSRAKGLRIFVKSIDTNGKLNRAFVKVCF